MGRILLLEDEESVNRGISFTLQKEGYEVSVPAAVWQRRYAALMRFLRSF